jgi:outer membrane receptor protein involved in Fe transport
MVPAFSWSAGRTLLFIRLLGVLSGAALTGNLLVAQTADQANEAPAQTPPPLKTTVTVNSTISSEVPASITVLNTQQLHLIPGIEMDDRLPGSWL